MALLAVVAVVGFMAKAGLPWWVVAAVALLTAGFAAGVTGSPPRGARSTTTPGSSAEQPTMSLEGGSANIPPVSVNVGGASPDDWDAPVPTAGADRALR